MNIEERKRVHRRTSLAAYASLIESGTLPDARADVWKWLYEYGPATRNEVSRGIHGIPGAVSTRLKELVQSGNVKEVGEGKCKVSGRELIIYDVTDKETYDRISQKRKGKKFYAPQSCGVCPLVAVDDADREVCWMDMTMETAQNGRPEACPLNDKDFVIRST